MPQVSRNSVIGKNSRKENCAKRTIKKKNATAKNTYTVDQLQIALNAIGKGETLREVAKKYGVPKSTLFSKSKNHFPLECERGAPTVLTPSEEADIVSWLKYCAQRGFPITKIQFLNSVQKFVTDTKREVPFRNNRPGRHWYNAFMQRHPDLSLRVGQNLTCTRASVAENDIRDWFSRVKANLESQDLLNIHPSRMFNCDESSFMLCPENDKYLAEKGASAVYNIVGGSDKECLTVLVMASASGAMPPPMILFEAKTIPKRHVLKKIPENWGVGLTEKGWMTSDSFYCYITNVFYKWLKESNIEFPIVLYVDGHSSHVTLPLCKFCKDNQIELVSLYPNATHILQPLDVAFFHPLKVKYRQVLFNWRLQNNVVNFKKDMFAEVLKIALEEIDFSKILENGFRVCGLFPFDPEAVNYNVLNKRKKKVQNVQINESQESCAISKNNKEITECEQVLRYFETHLIKPEVLNNFISVADSLIEPESDNISNEALFECWIKLKRTCDKTLIYRAL